MSGHVELNRTLGAAGAGQGSKSWNVERLEAVSGDAAEDSER